MKLVTFGGNKLLWRSFLVGSYFAVLAASVFTLLSSPLGGSDVSIPSMFLVLYFVATMLLLLSVLSAHFSTNVCLLLVVTHSVVSLTYFSIIFYPGTGGDNWVHLAYEVGFEKGWLTQYQVSRPWVTSPISKIYMMLRTSGQYILIATFSRIFVVDLYWVHTLFMPMLWGIFAPLIAFKIAEEISGDRKASLISGFLAGVAPTFFGWGSRSVPNSLGFLFFFFTLYCSLKSISKGGRWYFIIALLGGAVALLSHFMGGVFVLSLILAYLATRIYRRSPFAFPLVIGLVAASALTIPVSVLVLKQVYPIYSFFSLEKFYELDVYELVLADYASMDVPQFLSSCALFFLGIVGMFQLETKPKTRKIFMAILVLILMFQYRFLYYFIVPSPFSPRRLWGFRDLLLTPFAAVTIATLFHWGKKGFEPFFGARHIERNAGKRLFGVFKRIKQHIGTRELLISLLVVISLSSFVSDGMFRAYDYLRAHTLQVTTAQLDVLRTIHEEYLETGERYVIVSDRATSVWSAGIVGYFNPNEVTFMYEDIFFMNVISSPLSSPLYLASAVKSAEETFGQNYSIGYFIAVKSLIKFYTGKDGEMIMNSLSNALTTSFVSSDGEIAVFEQKFPLLSKKGEGAEVQVIRDGVATYETTMYSYTWLSDVAYNLALSGSSTYKITGWPIYWFFTTVEPTSNTVSIDSNSWINFTGSPDVTYVVRWKANEFYRERMIWREDSFLLGWDWYYATGGLRIGSFESDGIAANESISGKSDYYSMFRQEISLTPNATSFIARLKGTRNAEFMIQLLDAEDNRLLLTSWIKPILTYKEYEWALPEKLTSGVTGVILIVKTTDGSDASIFWDYVALLK